MFSALSEVICCNSNVSMDPRPSLIKRYWFLLLGKQSSCWRRQDVCRTPQSIARLNGRFTHTQHLCTEALGSPLCKVLVHRRYPHNANHHHLSFTDIANIVFCHNYSNQAQLYMSSDQQIWNLKDKDISINYFSNWNTKARKQPQKGKTGNQLWPVNSPIANQLKHLLQSSFIFWFWG